MAESATIDDLVLQATGAVEPPKDNTNQDRQPALPSDAPKPDPVADLLKELGVESLDSLKERLKKPEAPPADLTPEEKAKQDEAYKADLINYAVKNGNMKVEDFNKLDALKAKADADLVFEQHLKEFKEDNPDIEESEVEQDARADFERKYGINSDKEKVKARGISKLAKEAAEIRNPTETVYKTVKEKFDEERDIQKNLPGFEKKMTEAVNGSIPLKFEIFKDKDGDEDITVSVEITEAERKELAGQIQKKLNTVEVFNLYKKGETQKIQDIVQRETANFLQEKKGNEGLKKIADVYTKRGFEKGRVGATNSFALNQGGFNQADNLSRQSAEQEVLDSLKGKK